MRDAEAGSLLCGHHWGGRRSSGGKAPPPATTTAPVTTSSTPVSSTPAATLTITFPTKVVSGLSPTEIERFKAALRDTLAEQAHGVHLDEVSGIAVNKDGTVVVSFNPGATTNVEEVSTSVQPKIISFAVNRDDATSVSVTASEIGVASTTGNEEMQTTTVPATSTGSGTHTGGVIIVRGAARRGVAWHTWGWGAQLN